MGGGAFGFSFYIPLDARNPDSGAISEIIPVEGWRNYLRFSN